MPTEVDVRPISRRTAIRVASAALAGVSLQSCGGCYRDVREFRIARAFEWDPIDAARDMAFAFVSDRIVDYVDTLCDGCGAGTRFFLFALDVAITAATVSCPGCSIGTRLTVAVARELFVEMATHGFTKAIGLFDGDSYLVRKVAPVVGGGRYWGVNRSAVCYGIENREPTALFDREIAAFPERICYFTEVAGAPGLEVVHVWRCNGVVTDRIPVRADGGHWRTWTNKKNLARGTWIITTELHSGEVLDSREFHIS